MWLWMALASAVLLGLYDVAKKHALARNDVYYVLLGATLFTVLFLSPWVSAGTPRQHLMLAFKAVLVTVSWVSGMIGLKLLPITTVSTIKASRPMFVVLFSILLFGERLGLLQWAGVAVMLTALWLLSRSSEAEGISFRHNRGIWAMGLSVLAGVASALYDKHIVSGLQMEPLFVQFWCNVYIALLLGAVLAYKAFLRGARLPHPSWDWTIVLIAVLITCADALYFFSLREEGALLSVISMLRRASVVVTFVLGALLFRERKLRGKAVSLALLLAGMALLLYGTV
ncbi:MAG: EamA family transporter [Bacteroidales bacterium]|nr:EamA family transporter [Bacteroidales bacterium]